MDNQLNLKTLVTKSPEEQSDTPKIVEWEIHSDDSDNDDFVSESCGGGSCG